MTTPNESETNGIGRRTALKKGLLVTTIAGVGVPAGFGGVATAGLGQGVVAHYQLNNLKKRKGRDQTRDVVTDSSSNKNDGTWANPADDPVVDGKVENAFEFDGDDKVTAPDDPFDFGQSNFTLAAWIKTTSDDQSIVANQSPNDDEGWNGFNFYILPSGELGPRVAWATDGSFGGINGDTAVNDGDWHHVAFVFNGADRTNWKIRIDGSEDTFSELGDDLDETGEISNDDNLLIGDRPWGSPFDGKIDDVYIYDRALDDSEICQLFMRGLEDGLVAYYPLDEFADTTVVPDESENDNDGEASGDPTVVGGLVDNAFAFDGDDHVSVPDDPLLDLTQELTLAAWIKPPDTAQTNFTRVISRETSGVGNRQYNVGFDSAGTNPRAIVDTTGTNSVEVVGTTDVTDDDWHHVAMTFDSNDSLTIYVDGESEDSSSVSSQLVSRTSPVTIGREAHGGAGFFYTGLIDEVRIYDRVLPASEIEGLHHCQSP